MHSAPPDTFCVRKILLWTAGVALTSTAAQAQEGPHWSYSGDAGPTSVLISGGSSNVLRQVFANLPPSGQKEASVAGVTLDLTQLLPKVRGCYTFAGSLTTPPCNEHVRWFVLKRAMQASSGELVLFAARYPNNARPTKPLDGRPVEQTQD